MKPFFDSTNQSVLDAAATAWKGTPFATAGAVRGPRGGACCHRAVAGVLIDAGFPLTQEELPDWPLNRGTHHAQSVMLAWLREHRALFEEISIEAIAPGDIVALLLGKSVHHMGLALPEDRFFQSWEGQGAHITRITDRQISKRIEAAFRPIHPAS